jgi:hypothetical protein
MIFLGCNIFYVILFIYFQNQPPIITHNRDISTTQAVCAAVSACQLRFYPFHGSILGAVIQL